LACLNVFLAMLYIFAHLHTAFLKFGWTEQNVHRRAHSFWTLSHPPECCGCLGYDDFVLLAVFKGGRSDEVTIHGLLPPIYGEFWPIQKLQEMLALLRERFEELPLPDKPDDCKETSKRRTCCSGVVHRCYRCPATFELADKLWQHIDDVHRDQGLLCDVCGVHVKQLRNMERHQASKPCISVGRARRLPGLMQMADPCFMVTNRHFNGQEGLAMKIASFVGQSSYAPSTLREAVTYLGAHSWFMTMNCGHFHTTRATLYVGGLRTSSSIRVELEVPDLGLDGFRTSSSYVPDDEHSLYPHLDFKHIGFVKRAWLDRHPDFALNLIPEQCKFKGRKAGKPALDAMEKIITYFNT
jgi:hypothetical protein